MLSNLNLNLKKLFRNKSIIDPELTFKHCKNEHDNYVLNEKEKKEQRAYELNFDGFTHSTRGRLLI